MPTFGLLFLNSRKRFSAALFVVVAVFIASGLPTFLRTWSGRKIPDDFLVVYSAARAMLNQVDIYAGTAGMYIYSPFLALSFNRWPRCPNGQRRLSGCF